MSNPRANPNLGSAVAVASFASAVTTLPALRGARDHAGLQRQIEEMKALAREEAAREGYGEGRSAGWAEGHRSGREAGRREAMVEAAEARAVAEAEIADELARLHARVQAGWRAFAAGAEAALTERAMDAVREILAAELALSRAGAHAIVARCLGETTHAASVRIRVDARDLPGLADLLAASHPGLAVELVADGSVGAGCVVESASGRVDGTVGTALRLLEEAYDEAA